MTERLEEGYRADLATVATVHDVDDHQVAVDFPHEVMDNYRTDWARGCWDESFARRLPVMVWNHNPDLLIGAGVRTESLGDRSRVVQRFANFDAVPQARAAHSMISDQIVPGFSFHFRNARSVDHPSVRGARRYVKADMLEVSPVTFPSIPGAVAAGIRSEETLTVDIPTLEQILQLKDRHLIDDEGVRALIAEHHPHIREHIRIPAAPTPAAPVQPDGREGVRDDDDDSPQILAQAVDAALDEACQLLNSLDVASLPEAAQQAAALTQAAGVAVDELLEVMGVADPDDPDEGSRAKLTAKARDRLPDTDFAYIDPDGGRHLPIPDADHVRDALARFDQTVFHSDEAKKTAKAKIEAAAEKFGVHVSTPARETSRRADSVGDDDLNRVLDRLARF